ncbi:MAG: hypothetical protein R3B09_19205 [Nannocystaceae bacterium]
MHSRRRPLCLCVPLALALGLGAPGCARSNSGGDDLANRKVGDIELPGGKRLEHAPEILGHFAIANGSQLLADVRTHLVTPQYQNFLDENALRSMVSMALSSQGMVSQNFDLASPMGCAVVDPKTFEVPMSCVFGYKGGSAALLKDLGEVGRQAETGGHVAVYTLEGKPVYIDALGSSIVVSGHPDLYGKTKDYLQSAIVDRGQAMAGDVEAIGYVGAIWEKYRADLEPLLDLAASMQSTAPATGNPHLDALTRRWTTYTQTSTKESLRRFGDYDQAAFYLNVDNLGVAMGVTLLARPGSDAEKEAKAHGGRAVDPVFLQRLPQGTIMLGAFNADPAAYDSKSVKEMRDLAVDAWAEVTGKDANQAKATLDKYTAESREIYDGLGAFVFFHEAPGPGALGIVQHMAPGKSGRDAYHRWAEGFTTDAILGPELSKYVAWEFKNDAYNADGVAVDRMIVRPGPDLQQKIDKEMSEKERGEVDKYFGPMQLTIDRAEVNGVTLVTMAPKAEEAAMKRLLAAQKGTGSLGEDPGLAVVSGKNPASGVFAVDLKAGSAWLASFPPIAEAMKKMPAPIGNNLADVYFRSYYLESGATSFEYVFSQQVIEQIKVMVQKAG